MSSPTRLALSMLVRKPSAVFGFTVLLAVTLLAVFAPWLAPHDPLATSWSLVRRSSCSIRCRSLMSMAMPPMQIVPSPWRKRNFCTA